MVIVFVLSRRAEHPSSTFVATYAHHSAQDERRLCKKRRRSARDEYLLFVFTRYRSFRSARWLLFILLSSLSFIFHNLMYSFNIATDQCFFLRTTPTFNSVFPLKSFRVCFHNLTPNKLNGATSERVRFRMRSCLMLFEATFQFSGRSCVVTTVSTFENINSVWHRYHFYRASSALPA